MSGKICLFVPSLAGGGAERVMATLASNFARLGYATQLVLAKPETEYATELHPDVRVVEFHASRLTQALIPLARHLRRERPDVLFSTIVEANIMAVVARLFAKVPVRTVIREASTPSVALFRSPCAKKRLAGRLLRWAYQRADTIIAVSKGVFHDLTEVIQLPAHKVTLIHNPVPIQWIRSLASEPVSHPWFVPNAPPVILSVGNLRRAKDYPTLLRAFATVRHQINARLLILGDGVEREALTSLIRELRLCEYVDMPGFDPNPFRYMRRARLFVLSSAYEGFPNVLVQALACGCPVVSTDCTSGPRDITNNGRYGRIVPVGDAEQLAAAIVEAFHRPPTIPPEEWLAQFDEESVTQKFLQVLLPNLESAS